MKIKKIIATIGNYSHVVIDEESFKRVIGYTPELPYTLTKDQKGRAVRVFEVDGVKLFSRRDKETKQTNFIMNKDDAEAHYDNDNVMSFDDFEETEPQYA